ncbi:MAG: hypothetical protein K8S15_08090 [Candidatus Aegiribacteria sp.]|nr:hypothetical protein [Candidatus Aegiribacteria sp.]
MDAIRGIFEGEITNWSDLGGSDEIIITVAREEGRSAGYHLNSIILRTA